MTHRSNAPLARLVREATVLAGALAMWGTAPAAARAAAGDWAGGLQCGHALAVQLLWRGPHGSAGGPHCAGAGAFGLAFLGLATLAIIALARLRHATDRRRLELARHLVEQGMQPPAELLVGQSSRDLRKGIVLVFASVGLVVAAAVKGDEGLAPVGLIPGFIGLGYLVSYGLATRKRSP